MTFENILNIRWNENSVQDYLITVGIAICLFIFFKLFHTFILRKVFQSFKKQRKFKFVRRLFQNFDSFHSLFYGIVAVDIAIIRLNIPEFYHNIVQSLSLLILGAYTIRLVEDVIVQLVFKVFTTPGENPRMQSTIQLTRLVVKIVLWVLLVVLTLQALEVNVATLVGTLGISGIIIAFGLQSILADMFASLSIYFDRPFEVGNVIKVGDKVGSVEKIGIKSTRIKSIEGQMLVFSNKKLTEEIIENFSDFERRRVTFSLYIHPETDPEKLRQIPDYIKNLIESFEICTFDWCVFSRILPNALQFDAAYFIDSSDFKTYIDIQQKINLETLNLLTTNQIRLAQSGVVVQAK